MTAHATRRVAAVTLAALLLASCGENSPAPTGGTQTPSQPTPAQPAPAQPAPAPAQSAAATVDPAFPAYAPREGIAGSLKSVGSDTMNNLMAAWAASFKGFYPAATLAVEGAGSSTAPPALNQGLSQFGPMSRAMKQSEIDQFRESHGYEPTALRTSIDCLAVYVHRDCPLEQITLEQVANVFAAGPSLTWADLGVTDPAWADKPIAVYGRNEASGTYGFFKEFALGGRDFRDTVRVQQGSSGVVQAVATDPFAMGYSGIGYRTADVKPLALSSGSEDFVAPTPDHAMDGRYPLARFLYLYVNHNPAAPLDPLRAEFIRLIFSREGQEGVIKDGYFPVTPAIAAEELQKVGLASGR